MPRDKTSKQKLRGIGDPPERAAVRLACGHATTGAPLVTGAATLYRCPEPGCGKLSRGTRINK